jgi:hypothetical protein
MNSLLKANASNSRTHEDSGQFSHVLEVFAYSLILPSVYSNEKWMKLKISFTYGPYTSWTFLHIKISICDCNLKIWTLYWCFWYIVLNNFRLITKYIKKRTMLSFKMKYKNVTHRDTKYIKIIFFWTFDPKILQRTSYYKKWWIFHRYSNCQHC